MANNASGGNTGQTTPAMRVKTEGLTGGAARKPGVSFASATYNPTGLEELAKGFQRAAASKMKTSAVEREKNKQATLAQLYVNSKRTFTQLTEQARQSEGGITPEEYWKNNRQLMDQTLQQAVDAGADYKTVKSMNSALRSDFNELGETKTDIIAGVKYHVDAFGNRVSTPASDTEIYIDRMETLSTSNPALVGKIGAMYNAGKEKEAMKLLTDLNDTKAELEQEALYLSRLDQGAKIDQRIGERFLPIVDRHSNTLAKTALWAEDPNTGKSLFQSYVDGDDPSVDIEYVMSQIEGTVWNALGSDADYQEANSLLRDPSKTQEIVDKRMKIIRRTLENAGGLEQDKERRQYQQELVKNQIFYSDQWSKILINKNRELTDSGSVFPGQKLDALAYTKRISAGVLETPTDYAAWEFLHMDGIEKMDSDLAKVQTLPASQMNEALASVAKTYRNWATSDLKGNSPHEMYQYFIAIQSDPQVQEYFEMTPDNQRVKNSFDTIVRELGGRLSDAERNQIKKRVKEASELSLRTDPLTQMRESMEETQEE